jgi:putative tricarboxylic transport membrane protein
VGTDTTYGADRFSFGLPILADGIDFLVVMVGAYGIGEVLTRLERGFSGQASATTMSTRTELPSLREIAAIKGTLIRSTILGNIIGIIPGAGATIASFISYGVEGQFGRRKALLGTGIPEGIVAPQGAATASVGGAMIPLLAIGIPGSGATAVILGAFMLKGIQPGPQVLLNQPDLVYAIFASIFLGIAVMAILGYVAIRLFVKILNFPEAAISAYVMVFCFIGALSIRSNITDLWLTIAFGVIGYLFERLRFPIAPMVLGVILGPLAEESFMNSMISFGNDWTVFFTRPIAGALMACMAVVLLLPVVTAIRLRGRGQSGGGEVADARLAG